MAPAFFWFVVVMPPTLLAAALLPPARPLRGRRLTLGLAGGVVIAVALLLLLGLVLPLLDVGVNVKT